MYFCTDLTVLNADDRGRLQRDVSRKRLCSRRHPSHYFECVTLFWLDPSSWAAEQYLPPHILFRVTVIPCRIFLLFFSNII